MAGVTNIWVNSGPGGAWKSIWKIPTLVNRRVHSTTCLKTLHYAMDAFRFSSFVVILEFQQNFIARKALTQSTSSTIPRLSLLASFFTLPTVLPFPLITNVTQNIPARVQLSGTWREYRVACESDPWQLPVHEASVIGVVPTLRLFGDFKPTPGAL